MKLIKAIEITTEIMATNRVASSGTNNRTTRVRRTLTRNHGKIRTRSHGTKIRGPSTVTRTPSPKMIASQLLKMLSIFVLQVMMRVSSVQ